MSYKPWTVEEENQLRELVTARQYSYNQMTQFFTGRSGTGLRKHAIDYLKMNQKGRVHFKYSYNQAFFAVPNPVNCYVAGYYAADGHIADNPTTRLLCMELSHLEWHQLETFKRLMEYTGPIRDSSYPGRDKMCALRLYSAYQITADLEKHFGLTPRKTHRLPAPNLADPHLQLCYLVGLIDGDGCMQISNTNRLSISYTSSSRTIVEWVKSFVDSLGLSSIKRGRRGNVRSASNSTEAYTYQVCGLKAIDLIKRVQKLKSEGIPILDRKWDNDRLNAYIRDFETTHHIISPILGV